MTPPKHQGSKAEEELDHPCKNTCSGWQQGFEKGKRLGREDGAEAERANWITLQEEYAYLRARVERLENENATLKDKLEGYEKYAELTWKQIIENRDIHIKWLEAELAKWPASPNR